MCKIVLFFNNCRVSGCKTRANQLCIDRDVSTAMLPVFVKRRGPKLLLVLWRAFRSLLLLIEICCSLVGPLRY